MARAGRTCANLKWVDGVQVSCPKIATHGNRCAQCAAEKEAARGSRAARGYDAAYDRARIRAAVEVAAGRAICWRDGQPIKPGSDWHLGHEDGVLRGPEHAACNLHAAGRKAHGLEPRLFPER